ncbi:hypothetical protein HanIR_Chr05g0241961 [Helianthus annuus]|nr:hypothetical protein HanIR_Chr05g0241961 [Helianthus annuus]
MIFTYGVYFKTYWYILNIFRVSEKNSGGFRFILGLLYSPHLILELVLEIYFNKCGYFLCISDSSSHVYSGPLLESHFTLTRTNLLRLRFLTFLSSICRGFSTNLSCSFISISLRGTTSDSSAKHFLILDT